MTIVGLDIEDLVKVVNLKVFSVLLEVLDICVKDPVLVMTVWNYVFNVVVTEGTNLSLVFFFYVEDSVVFIRVQEEEEKVDFSKDQKEKKVRYTLREEELGERL